MGNKLGYGAEEPADSYPYRVLMLGLDGAGKTTVLNHIKTDKSKKDEETVPTIGFNVESVTHNQNRFIVWDVGGQSKIRVLWRHYFTHTDAVLFVVDSSDSERIKGGLSRAPLFSEAKVELDSLLLEAELQRCVVLILCNKCDLPYSMSTEALQLDRLSMKKRQWFITPTIANKGIGLVEGLNWLGDALKVNRGLLSEGAAASSAMALAAKPPAKAAAAAAAHNATAFNLKDDPTLAKAKAAEALAKAAILQDLAASEAKSKSHLPAVAAHRTHAASVSLPSLVPLSSSSTPPFKPTPLPTSPPPSSLQPLRPVSTSVVSSPSSAASSSSSSSVVVSDMPYSSSAISIPLPLPVSSKDSEFNKASLIVTVPFLSAAHTKTQTLIPAPDPLVTSAESYTATQTATTTLALTPAVSVVTTTTTSYTTTITRTLQGVGGPGVSLDGAPASLVDDPGVLARKAYAKKQD